jgi:hypothetical protein
MKTFFFALLLMGSACTLAHAQPSHLESVYRQYSDGNTQIGIDPGLLLNVSFSSNKVSNIHCLIVDGKKTPHAAREFRDLEHAVLDDHFEEWFSIRKGKGKVAAYSLDGPGDSKDLVFLLVGDDDSGLFVHLRGHFTDADKARIEAALQK